MSDENGQRLTQDDDNTLLNQTSKYAQQGNITPNTTQREAGAILYKIPWAFFTAKAIT